MATENPTTNPSEVWKPVVGYEGLYEVSNHGRVRRIGRHIPGPRGGQKYWPGRVLKPNVKAHGYPQVALFRLGIGQTWSVHLLVAESFLGPRPSRDHQCRHLNGNRGDPGAHNLSWGTPAENRADQRIHGTAPIGGRNPFAKLSDEAVREMRRLRKERGLTFTALGVRFGINKSTARRVCRGATWKHAAIADIEALAESAK